MTTVNKPCLDSCGLVPAATSISLWDPLASSASTHHLFALKINNNSTSFLPKNK